MSQTLQPSSQLFHILDHQSRNGLAFTIFHSRYQADGCRCYQYFLYSEIMRSMDS